VRADRFDFDKPQRGLGQCHAIIRAARVRITIPARRRRPERRPAAPGSYGHNVEGSGLGLAIAHEIVVVHGGRIELAPATQEGGLRVRVSIPLVSATSA